MSLLNELKRRNVFKVTTAYLALGWVVLEGSGTVASVLRLPEWTSSLLFWLGLAGLPFVVVFAWVFELTPEGLQRTSEVAPGQSITGVTSKRLDYVIIGMLAVAIGLFLLQYVRPHAAPPVATNDAKVTPAAPAAEVAAPAPSVPAMEPATVAPNDKSIAVLPFADMSQAKDQEYFSDGMSEELLNLLAQARDLKVIARTSSFAFKGTNTPIAEIARQLNVAHVLEGSVRKAGNTVRITAQLVRTADSTHLWSETWDRPLDDIFKVQDEIANAIVRALQIKLAGGELEQRIGGTRNLEAYQAYLRGLSELATTSASIDAAMSYYEQAIALDPGFGMAHAALSNIFSLKSDSGLVLPVEGYGMARELAQRALQLSPDLANAHSQLQFVYMNYDWDWAAAGAEGRRALALDPGNDQAMNAFGRLYAALGQWDESEKQFRLALEHDPLNEYIWWNLGDAYYRAGRTSDADAVFRKLLRMAPEFSWARSSLAKTLLVQGKIDEALELVDQETDEKERLYVLPTVLRASGREMEAAEALRAQISAWGDICAYCVAQVLAYRGEHDLAIEWLERAFSQRDSALMEITGEPLFKSMANDPRFIAFLKKMNLPTEPVPVNWQ